jgi:excisionase family DNA binding protein
MEQGETSLPVLLDVAQLAEYLGVPVSTIHYWRSQSQGPPALKVGRRLRFRVIDVVRWLEDEGVGADEPTLA